MEGLHEQTWLYFDVLEVPESKRLFFRENNLENQNKEVKDYLDAIRNEVIHKIKYKLCKIVVT